MSNSQVLVVDDEADIRALIQEILSDEGYGVTVAANAEEARSARGADNFDLILLDLVLMHPFLRLRIQCAPYSPQTHLRQPPHNWGI